MPINKARIAGESCPPPTPLSKGRPGGTPVQTNGRDSLRGPVVTKSTVK